MTALVLVAAACGGDGGFASLDAIEEDLRTRVAADVPDGSSAGEATCLDDESTGDLRTYDCQVQVFALRPRDDQIVRFRVEATSDGRWTARRTGVVTFD